MMRIVSVLFMLLLLVIPAAAQNEDDGIVTDDDVNDIASQLYCPVCENIPLDTCGTAACNDWRNEIRGFLEDGMTEDQIIDDFVARFGDRVVGTPQDPVLRMISLVTPWVVIGLGLFFGWRMFQNRMVQQAPQEEVEVTSSPNQSGYQDLLEQDIAG